MSPRGITDFEEYAGTVTELIDFARAKGLTVATAESCTGGMVAGALTSIAGSSEVFLGSVVSYANEVKMGLLDVESETLETVGAVSEETALQMARGARRVTGATCAVSTTGIAGPGGGSPEKPVGTVWIALVGDGRECAWLYHFAGTRARVRQAATEAALQKLSCFVRDTVG